MILRISSNFFNWKKKMLLGMIVKVPYHPNGIPKKIFEEIWWHSVPIHWWKISHSPPHKSFKNKINSQDKSSDPFKTLTIPNRKAARFANFMAAIRHFQAGIILDSDDSNFLFTAAHHHHHHQTKPNAVNHCTHNALRGKIFQHYQFS